MASTTKKVTVSAPGKVLLAGGYLVLEYPNVGVVVSVDKRFYVTVTVNQCTTNAPAVDITVESPQFEQSWKYTFDKSSMKLSAIQSNKTSNAFVEKTLRISLISLLHSVHPGINSISLHIKADNDFYSLVPHLQERSLDRTVQSALQLPSFLPAPTKNGNVLKTGLGSSACLVTSIVGGLCYSLAKNPDRNFIYNLSQLCHCYAQGKVGSGFDVSAAYHGSHIYQRFPKTVLADLLNDLENEAHTPLEKLETILNQKWPGGVARPLSLPPFLQIILADISGGSESPGMARAVLNWKNEQSQQSDEVSYWSDLSSINSEIAQQLETIFNLPINVEQVDELATTISSAWSELGPLGQTLLLLRTLFQSARRNLKEMGEAAGVPIEPESQSRLLDATMQLPGVVAAVVPGAGGFDALVCIYLDRDSVRNSIGKLWAGWTDSLVCPLTAHATNAGAGIKLST